MNTLFFLPNSLPPNSTCTVLLTYFFLNGIIDYRVETYPLRLEHDDDGINVTTTPPSRPSNGTTVYDLHPTVLNLPPRSSIFLQGQDIFYVYIVVTRPPVFSNF